MSNFSKNGNNGLDTEEKKIQRLITLLQTANADYASYEQVAELVGVLVQAIRATKTELETTISKSEVKKAIAALNKAESRLEKVLSENIASTKTANSKEIARAFAEIQKLIPKPFDPAYLQSQIDEINAEEPTKVEAEEVRDLLETLEGEERLDASAVKNLPEFVKEIQTGLPAGPQTIWGLTDVDIAGIQPGQHLEWDGIKWIAVTPAGSSGTPVWGEDLTSQGPGTVYTLAHTPVSGTVRVFRGGAYQQAGVSGDYTLSGSTITFSVSTQVGEIILCDYSY